MNTPEIKTCYGGTEWCADPCAWYGDQTYYDEYQREADVIFEKHPNIDMVRFGHVGDVGEFLDTTEDFDMHVIGEHDGEMVYVREEWDCTWRFSGLHVTRYACWLEWCRKHGPETLTCDLDRIDLDKE